MRIEQHSLRFETIFAGLVMNLRRVEGINGEFKAPGVTTGRLKDRLRHFHRVELNRTKFEGYRCNEESIKV